jgi:hypothetical protein
MWMTVGMTLSPNREPLSRRIDGNLGPVVRAAIIAADRAAMLARQHRFKVAQYSVAKRNNRSDGVNHIAAYPRYL